jgi:hypothetical protein
MGQIISSRCTLSVPAVRVLRIPLAEEPAAALRRFAEYAVSGRIWRPVGDAVLHHVNVNTRPARTVEILALNTLHNFLDGEIRGVGAFTMEESGGHPNFLSDFQFRANRNGHWDRPCGLLHLYQVLMNCQWKSHPSSSYPKPI